MTIGQFTGNFLYAHMNFKIHQNKASQALMRLSTGKRINSAADDAAGLGISQRMRANISGLNMQIRNAKDKISELSTADGAMNETQDMLQRMRELTVQAENGTYTDEDRKLLDQEYRSAMDAIDGLYAGTKYNNQTVLNAEDLNQTGGTSQSGGEKTLRETDILTIDNAREAKELLDRTVNAVSCSRAGVGSSINILDRQISALEEEVYNATSCLSTIEDADMAAEMLNYTKESILMQVSQAMMAHVIDDSQVIVKMLTAM